MTVNKTQKNIKILTKNTNTTSTPQILSPTFSTFPKPTFIQTSPAETPKKAATERIKRTKKSKKTSVTNRSQSCSPAGNKSKNARFIPISPELRPASPKDLLGIACAPKRIESRTPPMKHSHFADGAYANAPHPSELAAPVFM